MTTDVKSTREHRCLAIVQTFAGIACCAILCCDIVRAADAPQTAEPPKLQSSTVGLPVDVKQIVLPGTELESTPWDDKSPVVVRIIEVYPHGDAFRYDLSYQGLEPGDYDLG